MTEWLDIGPAFSVVAWTDGETVRIDVAGELDVATCPRLKRELLAAIEAPAPPREIRIDLAAVTFIDARGVGVLVEGRVAAGRSGVDYGVQNAHGIVLRVLDIFGLVEALQLTHTTLTSGSSSGSSRSRACPPASSRRVGSEQQPPRWNLRSALHL